MVRALRGLVLDAPLASSGRLTENYKDFSAVKNKIDGQIN
jgi:hypothetical protein